MSWNYIVLLFSEITAFYFVYYFLFALSFIYSIGYIGSEGFITQEMNTDQYYNLGLALGLSYHVLDSIQFRSRQHEEPGLTNEEGGVTPNKKAGIAMIRSWKCLQDSVSLADGYLREVWKSVNNSVDSDRFQEQEPRAGDHSDLLEGALRDKELN